VSDGDVRFNATIIDLCEKSKGIASNSIESLVLTSSSIVECVRGNVVGRYALGAVALLRVRTERRANAAVSFHTNVSNVNVSTIIISDGFFAIQLHVADAIAWLRSELDGAAIELSPLHAAVQVHRRALPPLAYRSHKDTMPLRESAGSERGNGASVNLKSEACVELVLERALRHWPTAAGGARRR
jgi:hypothetical protein